MVRWKWNWYSKPFAGCWDIFVKVRSQTFHINSNPDTGHPPVYSLLSLALVSWRLECNNFNQELVEEWQTNVRTSKSIAIGEFNFGKFLVQLKSQGLRQRKQLLLFSTIFQLWQPNSGKLLKEKLYSRQNGTLSPGLFGHSQTQSTINPHFPWTAIQKYCPFIPTKPFDHPTDHISSIHLRQIIS